jgi:hypothetical protein
MVVAIAVVPSLAIEIVEFGRGGMTQPSMMWF